MRSRLQALRREQESIAKRTNGLLGDALDYAESVPSRGSEHSAAPEAVADTQTQNSVSMSEPREEADSVLAGRESGAKNTGNPRHGTINLPDSGVGAENYDDFDHNDGDDGNMENNVEAELWKGVEAIAQIIDIAVQNRSLTDHDLLEKLDDLLPGGEGRGRGNSTSRSTGASTVDSASTSPQQHRHNPRLGVPVTGPKTGRFKNADESAALILSLRNASRVRLNPLSKGGGRSVRVKPKGQRKGKGKPQRRLKGGPPAVRRKAGLGSKVHARQNERSGPARKAKRPLRKLHRLPQIDTSACQAPTPNEDKNSQTLNSSQHPQFSVSSAISPKVKQAADAARQRYLAHTSNFNPIKPLGGTSSLADAVKPNQQAGAAESKGVWRSRTLETLSNLLLTQAQQEQAERDGTDVMQTAPRPPSLHIFHLLQYHVSLALALGASRSHTAIARAMQRLVHMRSTSSEGGDEFDLLFRAAAAAEQAVAASSLRHRSTVRIPGQWETDFFAQLRGEDELRLVERAADRAAEEFAEFLQTAKGQEKFVAECDRAERELLGVRQLEIAERPYVSQFVGAMSQCAKLFRQNIGAVVRESPNARKRRGKRAAQYGEVTPHFDHHRDPANALHDSTAAAAAAGITVLLPDTAFAYALAVTTPPPNSKAASDRASTAAFFSQADAAVILRVFVQPPASSSVVRAAAQARQSSQWGASSLAFLDWVVHATVPLRVRSHWKRQLQDARAALHEHFVQAVVHQQATGGTDACLRAGPSGSLRIDIGNPQETREIRAVERMLDAVKETALRATLKQYRSATKVIVGRQVAKMRVAATKKATLEAHEIENQRKAEEKHVRAEQRQEKLRRLAQEKQRAAQAEAIMPTCQRGHRMQVKKWTPGPHNEAAYVRGWVCDRCSYNTRKSGDDPEKSKKRYHCDRCYVDFCSDCGHDIRTTNAQALAANTSVS